MTADASRLVVDRPYSVQIGRSALAGCMEHCEKLHPLKKLRLVRGTGAGKDEIVEILQLQPARQRKGPDDPELVACYTPGRLIHLAGARDLDVEYARSRGSRFRQSFRQQLGVGGIVGSQLRGCRDC